MKEFHHLRIRFIVRRSFKIEENVPDFLFFAFSVVDHEAVLVRMELVAVSAELLSAFVSAAPAIGISLIFLYLNANFLIDLPSESR
jgi:hypothetical protein